MSGRARPSGINAEVSKKKDAKYDSVAEKEAVEWMGDVLGDESLKSISGKDNVQERLKTGIDMANVMNTLQSGIIKKVHPAGSNNFKQMENIGNFLKAAENYGCQREDLFQTIDLSEGLNMGAVIGAIHAVGRMAQKKGFDGPTLGPKEADANPREFTEEQMNAGRVAGL